MSPFLLRYGALRAPVAGANPVPVVPWMARMGLRSVERRPISMLAPKSLPIGGPRAPRAGIPRYPLRQPPTRQLPTRQFRFSARHRSGANQKASPEQAAQAPLSLGARLRKLSREYGWVAVGVYFGLSVLDFPFCFLLVKVVGTDKIGQLEHFLTSNVAKVIPDAVKARYYAWKKSTDEADPNSMRDDLGETVEMMGWGVEEAQLAHKEEASLATQLALAYAIHKSFIFLRVPLAAAVTPKIVKVLRSWGWQIGKRQRKAK